MIREYVKGMRHQLSDHFNSDEFDCHCKRGLCIVTYIDDDLIAKLEEHRVKWDGKRITIISGFRCTAHNLEVKGKPGSSHLIGKAGDITVEGMTPDEVANDCEDMDGLGRYDDFTHVDVRGHKSRWDYRGE